MSYPLLALLKSWILPPGGIILALLLGLLGWRHRWGRALVATATLLLYLLSTPWFSSLLASGLEGSARPTAEQLASRGAQAILVLTAGRYSHAPELGGLDSAGRYTQDRLSWAALLHRKTGLPIILSGGRTADEDLSLAEVAAQTLEDRFGLRALAVETASTNTWENARLTARVLKRNAIQRVLVVTHAWHMPRAMLSLQQAGIDAVPAPTYFISGRGEGSELSDFMPSAQALLDSYFCLHEYLGIVWYQLKAK